MRRATGLRDERGVNESLQWALILPLVMLVVLGILQSAIWLHGRQAVQHAAVAAAEAESVLHPEPDAGERAARQITQIAGLRNVEVVVVRSTDQVSVTVSGTPPRIVDVGPGRVQEQAVMSRERVTRP